MFEDHGDLALLLPSLPVREKFLNYRNYLAGRLVFLLVVCLLAVQLKDGAVLDLAKFYFRVGFTSILFVLAGFASYEVL